MVEKFFQFLTVLTVIGIAAKIGYLYLHNMNKKNKNHHSSKPSHLA